MSAHGRSHLLRVPRWLGGTLAAMSVAINLLMLALPLYMLQIFDRVLSGRSLETLVMLTLAVFFALGVMGSLDACRTVMLARFGDWLERRLSRPLMLASVALSA